MTATSYKRFARFYDATMGDRSKEIERILSIVGKHAPNTKNLLELGCGTGALLSALAETYEATGIDQSPEMLRIARRKRLNAVIEQADMVKYRAKNKVDTVVCLFDSINHLPNYALWERLFRTTHRNLRSDGTFIFDINTWGRLERLSRMGPITQYFNSTDFSLTTVSPKGKHSFIWNIQVFERLERDLFRRISEQIIESAFAVEKIVSSLSKIFKGVMIFDESGAPIKDEAAQRLYFVCKA